MMRHSHDKISYIRKYLHNEYGKCQPRAETPECIGHFPTSTKITVALVIFDEVHKKRPKNIIH